jgi:uncharacterized membrane protein
MAFSKHRFEFFSDGLMAITMTIMVLEVNVSKPFSLENIGELLQSILIYFVSFFIVGWFLSRHHRLIDDTKKITNRIISRNLLFLFFVALIPVVTKLMIENHASNISVLTYTAVFLLANIAFFILTGEVWKQIPKEEIEEMKVQRSKYHKHPYIHMITNCIVVILIVPLAIIFPKLSIVVFIIIPIAFVFMNFFIEYDRGSLKKE